MNLFVRKGEASSHLLMELQGEVKAQSELDGMNLGKLKEENGKNTLVIGNHVLRGKQEIIKKPLYVVKKVQGGLEVIGTISNKIVFNERPAPIPLHNEKKVKHNFWNQPK
ncbi:unnamed protein product [Blepharisma stoltei]|uniref:Chromosome transmission fidelity protein 8 n=1 Tax=Blepharisma stoltei TaxID=1481888 RepID=A0AAU9J0Y5_9CILI|nr:unnamed protein product [Blepharisma stoltei]